MVAKKSNVKVGEIRIMLKHDTDPDVSYLTDKSRWSNAKEEAEDRRRLQAFEDGDWLMIGVVAEADVDVGGLRQNLTSGGIWNVESDSGKSYLTEIAEDQYDELVQVLKKLGAKQIPSFRSARWVHRY